MDLAHLSLEVFVKLVASGKVDDACWDFILCSTVTMMQVCVCLRVCMSVCLSLVCCVYACVCLCPLKNLDVVTPSQLCDDKVEATLLTSVLHCATLRLCLEMDLFFASSSNQHMVTEWKDFFSPAIGDAVVVQFKHILKCSKCDCVNM